MDAERIFLAEFQGGRAINRLIRFDDSSGRIFVAGAEGRPELGRFLLAMAAADSPRAAQIAMGGSISPSIRSYLLYREGRSRYDRYLGALEVAVGRRRIPGFMGVERAVLGSADPELIRARGDKSGGLVTIKPARRPIPFRSDDAELATYLLYRWQLQQDLPFNPGFGVPDLPVWLAETAARLNPPEGFVSDLDGRFVSDLRAGLAVTAPPGITRVRSQTALEEEDGFLDGLRKKAAAAAGELMGKLTGKASDKEAAEDGAAAAGSKGKKAGAAAAEDAEASVIDPDDMGLVTIGGYTFDLVPDFMEPALRDAERRRKLMLVTAVILAVGGLGVGLTAAGLGLYKAAQLGPLIITETSGLARTAIQTGGEVLS